MSPFTKTRCVLAIIAWHYAVCPVAAHDGPPYPIIVDHPTGPVLLSAWADPDVGIGTYHIYLEPLDGHALPDSCVVRFSVRPVTGRLSERRYEATPLRLDKTRYHYLGKAEFDAAEDWLTRIVVRCGARQGEAEKVVAVTPPGQGPVLDFILYLLPFAAVGFLIVRALVAQRRRPGNSA